MPEAKCSAAADLKVAAVADRREHPALSLSLILLSLILLSLSLSLSLSLRIGICFVAWDLQHGHAYESQSIGSSIRPADAITVARLCYNERMRREGIMQYARRRILPEKLKEHVQLTLDAGVSIRGGKFARC
ncbi:hypothetical protein VPH35_021033 [Triticum aestivum]